MQVGVFATPLQLDYFPSGRPTFRQIIDWGILRLTRSTPADAFAA
jgi:hypothetical protein